LGKSRLLEESAVLARRGGMRVGFGRAERDQVVPMAPLMSAFFGGPEPLLDRDAVAQLHALRDQRYWLMLELEGLLEQAALQNPLLVCLDDMHWADGGTVEALRVLPTRLASMPIVWIAAYRTKASAGFSRSISELEEMEARRLLLDPLDGSAVGEVIADLMKAEAEADLLEIADNAHGVPFLLVELLRGLLEEGLVRIEGSRALLSEARLPVRLRDSMSERLERVSAPARRAAVVASVLGRTFRFEDLAAMLDLAPSVLLEPIDELTRADILTDDDAILAFRHDIIRQAVLESVPTAARRALDRQAADVLLREPFHSRSPRGSPPARSLATRWPS
jgi:predicted ATPase